MIAFASSLEQGGPLGATVGDLALIMNVIAGFDPRDSTSIDRPFEDFTRKLGESINGVKIGVPKEYFQDNLDPGVAENILNAIDELKKLGAEIVRSFFLVRVTAV